MAAVYPAPAGENPCRSSGASLQSQSPRLRSSRTEPMNPDRFTLKTREVITAAQSLAEERRHPQVTPEHLLVTLLEQDETIVAPLLKKVGADIAGIRREANAGLDALPTL